MKALRLALPAGCSSINAEMLVPCVAAHSGGGLPMLERRSSALHSNGSYVCPAHTHGVHEEASLAAAAASSGRLREGSRRVSVRCHIRMPLPYIPSGFPTSMTDIGSIAG